MNLEVKLVIPEQGEPVVEFKGLWSRSDVQRAMNLMLYQLPRHLAKLREEAQNG